ncbi:MAG TPA: HEAT repeat domain-containing protein [Chryseolinea sp.]|nr:HEAT repeat domain-containing protein [Chryseolinea sp.]
MRLERLLLACLISLTIQSARSQSPQVGIVDFYGARSIKADVRKCLPFKENDTIKFLLTYPDTTGYAKLKQTVVGCLLSHPEIKQAKMEFVCCVDEKWMVFIGVSAKPLTVKKNLKTRDIHLAAEVTRTYDSMGVLLLTAIQSGAAGEDDSQGHALSNYAPLRKLEERFISYSAKHVDLLRDVLKFSVHPHERAVAASAIAYYHDKSAIANDLSDAAGDESEDVRNNAIRALGIIIDYLQQKPNQNIAISPDPFIALMNSIAWTDRNKSIIVLRALSSKRDPKLLLKLKNEALEPLIDMASWRSEGHAMAGYVVLGRIAGWKEEEIFESAKKDRSEMINKMLSSIR